MSKSAKQRFYENQQKKGKIDKEKLAKIMGTKPNSSTPQKQVNKSDISKIDVSKRSQGQSAREYLAQQVGGILNYKTGAVSVPKRVAVAQPAQGVGKWDSSKETYDQYQQRMVGVAPQAVNLSPQQQAQADSFIAQQTQPANPLSLMGNTPSAFQKATQQSISPQEQKGADEFLAKLTQKPQINQSNAVNQFRQNVQALPQQSAPEPGFFQKISNYLGKNKDNILEAPANATEFTVKHPLQAANNVLDYTVRPITRTALSTEASLAQPITGQDTIQTDVNPVSKFIFGKYPVTTYSKAGQDLAKGFDVKNPIAQAGISAALVGLDFVGYNFGNKKKVAETITKNVIEDLGENATKKEVIAATEKIAKDKQVISDIVNGKKAGLPGQGAEFSTIQRVNPITQEKQYFTATKKEAEKIAPIIDTNNTTPGGWDYHISAGTTPSKMENAGFKHMGETSEKDIKKLISPKEPPLIQEAKKYKTEEEFIKAQGKPIYHGTDKVFKELDVKKTPDGSIWFSDNLDSIKKGESGASGTKRIIDKFINENDVKLAGWDEYDNYSLDQLQQMGYDGVKLPENGKVDYQIFNLDKLKTKSQLSNIYKEAHAKESSLPTQLGKEDKTTLLSQDQRSSSSTLAAEKQSETAILSAGVEKGTGLKGESNSYADKLAQSDKNVNTGNRAVDYYTQGRDKITPMPDRVDAPIVFKNAVAEKGSKGKSVVQATKDIFDPVHGIVEGPQIKNAFREHAATYRYNSDLAAEASNIRSNVWDKVKPEERLNFIHSIETGTPQKGTEGLYKDYKDLFDKDYEVMKQINPDAPYRKDYFTHNGLWSDPEQANQFFSKWQKENLGGSKSFMKGREFPTIYDGLKAGLKIKETNPEKLFLNNHTNVLRAKMADDFMKEMITKGMPEGAVQAVIDRYLDRGIKGNAIYQTAKAANNALNSAQLGLSLFHASTETMEASVSQMAQGIKEITQGRVGTGLKSVAQSPIAVFKDYYVGNKIMKDAFSANPQFKQDIEYVLEGGGTFRRSKLYDMGQAKKMVENFREGGIKNYAKGTLRAPMAALEKLAAPLMENAVPRVKVGSFLSLAHSEMERLGPNVSKEVRRQVLAKAWDSIDNRFGELVQDNLLWNQTFKDVLNISTRSLGWNLGTVREIGGGVVDTLKPSTWKGVAKGEGITNRMAYTLSLPVVTAAVATMYMKMHGQIPSEPLDLAYPKTGEKTKQGYDERVSIPGYMKDIFAYKENTPQTILNKQSPIFTIASKLGELGLTGGIKDYYGNWVVDPYATDKEKSLQIAKWAVSQATPFSVSGSKQRVDQSTQAKAESVFGFNPAPAHIIKGSDVTDLNQLWRDMLPSVPKTPAESAAFDKQMQEADAKAGKTPEEAKKELDFLLELRKTGNGTSERTDLIQNYYNGLNESQRKSLNFKMMMAGISTKGVSTSDSSVAIKPTYQKVDELMKQGKVSEANQFIEGLSPEDKASFNRMRGSQKPEWYNPSETKTKDQALSQDSEKGKLYSTYQEKSKSNPSEAQKFLKSMDYPTYEKFKKERTIARTANTRQFKEYLASSTPSEAVRFIEGLDKTEQQRILSAMTPAMRQRYAEGKTQ